MEGRHKSGRSVSGECDENIIWNYQTSKNEKWAVNILYADTTDLSLIWFLKIIEIHFEKLFGTLLIHVKLNGTVKQKTLKSTGECTESSSINIGTGLKI